jgi:hypothetical protein
MITTKIVTNAICTNDYKTSSSNRKNVVRTSVTRANVAAQNSSNIFESIFDKKKSGSNFVLEFCLKISFDVVMEFPGNEGLVGVTGFRRVPVPVGVTSGRGWGWAAARKDTFYLIK